MIYSLFGVCRCGKCLREFVVYRRGDGKYWCEGDGRRVEVSRPKACCPFCGEHPGLETLWWV